MPFAPSQAVGAVATMSMSATENTSVTNGKFTAQSGDVRYLTVVLNNQSVSVTDDTNFCYGSVKLFDYPEGAFVSLGGTFSVTAFATATNLAGLASATSGQVFIGLGTAAAGANNDLTGTEIDIVDKTSTGALTSGAITATFRNTTQSAVAVFAGQATAKSCYLNIGASIDGTSSGTITVSGTFTVAYIPLGDN